MVSLPLRVRPARLGTTRSIGSSRFIPDETSVTPGTADKRSAIRVAAETSVAWSSPVTTMAIGSGAPETSSIRSSRI